MKTRFLVLFFLCAGMFGVIHGQNTRSVFFMRDLPQASRTNPAFTPESRFYFGVPTLSGIYFGFENGFSFNDLVAERDDDSLYIDRDRLISKLKDKNYLSLEFADELGFAGFAFGKNYIGFSVTRVFSSKLGFSDDFIKFLLYGNGNEDFLGKNVQMDGPGLNIISYREHAISYAREINENLTAGIRLKYLNGNFNIQTESSYFDINTDPDTYAILAKTDIVINASSELSEFDDIETHAREFPWFEFKENHGWGFDLGVNYKVNDHLSLSASFIDAGSIRWKENVENWKSTKTLQEFSFDGFEIDYFFTEDQFNDTIAYLDTLINDIGLEETANAYTSSLNSKIYLGGEFALNENNIIGVLVRGDIVDKNLKPLATFAFTKKLGRFISLMGNYSYVNKSYFNIGLGTIIKIGPLQIYGLNDNFYALFAPRETRNYNFQIGANLVFGKPKEVIDPEVEEEDSIFDPSLY